MILYSFHFCIYLGASVSGSRLVDSGAGMKADLPITFKFGMPMKFKYLMLLIILIFSFSWISIVSSGTYGKINFEDNYSFISIGDNHSQKSDSSMIVGKIGIEVDGIVSENVLVKSKGKSHSKEIQDTSSEISILSFSMALLHIMFTYIF